MKRLVHAQWALMVSLAVAAGACSDDGSAGSGTDGETDTDDGTGSATDSASTDPSATATQTASNSTTDSDTSPTTDPTMGTDSAATDSAGTDSAGSDSTGVDGTDTAATDSADSTGSDSTGASGYSISGTFRRSQTAAIGLGNDGIGDAYLGALVACEQDAADAGGTIVEDADLSSTQNEVPFTIDGLQDGTYYIAGFFDDNENADPNDPAPDMGDFATAEGFGIGCVEVTVDGADVTDVEVVYNFTVPF